MKHRVLLLQLACVHVRLGFSQEVVMLCRTTRLPSDIRDVLVEIYAANDCMNQLLFTHLDQRAWRARLPGTSGRKGRTIAAIFAHLHNSRLVWLRNSAPHLRCPAPLDPARCTMKQARPPTRKCSVTCLLTKRITEAKSLCLPTNSATGCPSRLGLASGGGTSCGNSVVSAMSQVKFARIFVGENRNSKR